MNTLKGIGLYFYAMFVFYFPMKIFIVEMGAFFWQYGNPQNDSLRDLLSKILWTQDVSSVETVLVFILTLISLVTAISYASEKFKNRVFYVTSGISIALGVSINAYLMSAALAVCLVAYLLFRTDTLIKLNPKNLYGNNIILGSIRYVAVLLITPLLFLILKALSVSFIELFISLNTFVEHVLFLFIMSFVIRLAVALFWIALLIVSRIGPNKPLFPVVTIVSIIVSSVAFFIQILHYGIDLSIFDQIVKWISVFGVLVLHAGLLLTAIVID